MLNLFGNMVFSEGIIDIKQDYVVCMANSNLYILVLLKEDPTFKD